MSQPRSLVVARLVFLLLVVAFAVPVDSRHAKTAPGPLARTLSSAAYPCNTGSSAGMTYTYADVHRWNAPIVQVANLTGVPANVIKGIMWVESRGMLNARSPLTAYGYYFGLMQIGPTSAVPESMKSVSWMCNNAYNQILAGATELVNKSKAIGSTDWTKVAGAYFGYGTDVNGTTTNTYMTMFFNHTNAMSGTTPGAADWFPPATPTPTPIPWQNFATGSTVTVDIAKLNMRSSPGTSATVIRVLRRGDTGIIIAGPTRIGSTYWYQIRLSDGAVGWISGQYATGVVSSPTPTLTPLASSTPTVTGTVTATPTAGSPTSTPTGATYRVTTRVNLRATPSTSGTILTTLASGTTVTLLGESHIASGHTWLNVQAGARTGWISARYLTPVATPTPTATSTATRPPASSATVAGERLSIWDRVEVRSGTVNFRSAPGTAAPVLGTLSSGMQGSVIAGPVSVNGVDWYQLRVEGRPDGWVAGQYLRLVSHGAPPEVTAIPSYTASITIEPSATATATLPAAEPTLEHSPTDVVVRGPAIPPTEPAPLPPPDADGDGIDDAFDACPGIVDSGIDGDWDTIDDACDPTPLTDPSLPVDTPTSDASN